MGKHYESDVRMFVLVQFSEIYFLFDFWSFERRAHWKHRKSCNISRGWPSEVGARAMAAACEYHANQNRIHHVYSPSLNYILETSRLYIILDSKDLLFDVN